MGSVDPILDIFRVNGLPETRPARFRFEFLIRGKKREVAGCAEIDALFFPVEERIGERAFRRFFSEDLLLLGGEPFFPLFVR